MNRRSAPLPRGPSWWPFAALVTAVVVLAATGVVPRWRGALQMVALPPLDLFADVRLLTARAPSWPVFVGGVAASVGVRAAVVAAVLGFGTRRARYVLGFYLAALPLALLAAGLDFAGRSVLYVPLVWIGLAVTLLTFAGLGASPWSPQPSVRDAAARVNRQRFCAGALAVYVVMLAALGGIAPRGGWVVVALVPVSGLLTAVAATRLRHRLRDGPIRGAATGSRRVAVGTAVIALATAFAPVPGDAPLSREGSLFVVAGVDTSSGRGSMFRFDPRAVGFRCRQTFYYSYTGTGRGARQRAATCPIRTGAPYQEPDTTRRFGALVASFADQVEELPPPVVVVTHSQGAWIAWAAIAAGRAPSVEQLVMLGPFFENLAAYPPRGRSGDGAVGGAFVRAVTWFGRAIGFSSYDADAPLARDLQARPGAIAAVFADPLPAGVTALGVASRSDLPLVPGPWPDRVGQACPGWSSHGGLPTSTSVTVTIGRFLDRGAAPGCAAWVRVLARPVDAFGAPSPATR